MHRTADQVSLGYYCDKNPKKPIKSSPQDPKSSQVAPGWSSGSTLTWKYLPKAIGNKSPLAPLALYVPQGLLFFWPIIADIIFLHYSGTFNYQLSFFFFHSLWEVIICMSDEKINGYSADQLFTMLPRQFTLLMKDALSGFKFWPRVLDQAVQGIALQLRDKTHLKQVKKLQHLTKNYPGCSLSDWFILSSINPNYNIRFFSECLKFCWNTQGQVNFLLLKVYQAILTMNNLS